MNEKIISFLASTKVFFYSLIAMMIILVVGTIAQKYVGLYVAQNFFFDSFIIWIKFLPLPGMSLVSLIIIINIFFKIFFFSPFSKEKSGIIITHIGIFVLLLGSAITGYFSQEGNIVIKEGESSNRVYDYHKRELLLYKIDDNNQRNLIFTIPQNDIKENAIIADKILSKSLKIVKNYRNSKILVDKKNNEIAIEKNLPSKNDEANIWGVEIEINSSSQKSQENNNLSNKKSVITIVENMVSLPILSFSGQKYTIELSKTNTKLPFNIYLEKFTKELHPGTMQARSYSSEIVLKDNDNSIEWKGIISMNNPLRYKGYTFYQSSFFLDGTSYSSVLAVVENKGRLFPYISSIIICIGILLHLFVRKKKISDMSSENV